LIDYEKKEEDICLEQSYLYIMQLDNLLHFIFLKISWLLICLWTKQKKFL